MNVIIALVFFLTPLAAQADAARLNALYGQLRCMVCTGQSLAESDAELAVAMREKIRSLAQEGKSDAQILDFMRERYGDAILLQPPVNGDTFVLWAGPGLVLLAGLGCAGMYLRRKS